ncbi:murein biosynthesis integral membrane protein MurJ [Candidatus Parcubacteria bacterium]|nr:MAG: murein biosynthesis integral membrane protein MurJ [Candidatus Parcubacteria bacterium]
MQYRHVIKSAAVVGSFVLLSRVFGLVRDIIFAAFFGTSLAKSAFDVAFRIPNLFRRLFGEGALSASFIPVFTDTLAHDGKEAAWLLARRVVTFLVVILSEITIIGIVCITIYLHFASPGDRICLVLELLRIMLSYALFICTAALSMAILNSFSHFIVPAATPVLLNLVLIGALIWVCPHLGDTGEERIRGVAWAVFVGGILQLVVQVPVLIRYGYRIGFSFNWSDSRLRKVLVLMAPAALGVGVTQINVTIGQILAYRVADWAPAALNYAEHMVYLPLGLFATSLGTVLLPAFSQHSARSDFGQITSMINKALRHLMFVMIPASVGMIILAQPMISLILENGSFTAESTWLTARALQFYAPGLFAFSLCKIFAPAFYSLKDTATPVKISLCAIALNFCLNVAGIAFLPFYYKHTSIALGSVVAETVNGVVLAWLLTRRIGSPGWAQIFNSLVRILICALIMGLAVYFAHGFFVEWLTTRGISGKAGLGMSVFGSIGLGILIYIAAGTLLCRDEFHEFIAVLKQRRRRPGQPKACGNGN